MNNFIVCFTVNINPLSSTQCQDGILAHNTNQMQSKFTSFITSSNVCIHLVQSTVPENNARRQEQGLLYKSIFRFFLKFKFYINK